jgi:hypothetical protein
MSHRYYSDSYAYPVGTLLLFVMITALIFIFISYYQPVSIWVCSLDGSNVQPLRTLYSPDTEYLSLPIHTARLKPPPWCKSNIANHTDEHVHHILMTSVTPGSFFKSV